MLGKILNTKKTARIMSLILIAVILILHHPAIYLILLCGLRRIRVLPSKAEKETLRQSLQTEALSFPVRKQATAEPIFTLKTSFLMEVSIPLR